MAEDATFEFIQQHPDDALSKETRTIIRKQAMRAVGARRRNVTQTTGPNSRGPPRRRRNLVQNPARSVPASGLELLVKDGGLDPMDFSALTLIHVQKVASELLYAKPGKLWGLLSCRQRSYFSFIPARFGRSSAMDDAFHCLMTQTHSILVPDHKVGEDLVLSQYGKALRSLQSAVDDPKLRSSSEAICACAILALFEVCLCHLALGFAIPPVLSSAQILHSPHENSWYQHIDGTARLLEARGPDNITSDFDKALFTALIYPISKGAFLSNQRCFLEDPEWVPVFESCLCPTESFTDRSELGISLFMLSCKVPGLAKRTTHAVTFRDTTTYSQFETIASDIRALRATLSTWRRSFNTALINVEQFSDENLADYSKRYELFGICLSLNILLDRMLVFMSSKDRTILEEEVQNLAWEIKTVQASIKNDERASFFLAQKAQVAEAAIATNQCYIDVPESENIVDVWRMMKFYDLIGRKCCDGNNCCPNA